MSDFARYEMDQTFKLLTTTLQMWIFLIFYWVQCSAAFVVAHKFHLTSLLFINVLTKILLSTNDFKRSFPSAASLPLVLIVLNYLPGGYFKICIFSASSAAFTVQINSYQGRFQPCLCLWFCETRTLSRQVFFLPNTAEDMLLLLVTPYGLVHQACIKNSSYKFPIQAKLGDVLRLFLLPVQLFWLR